MATKAKGTKTEGAPKAPRKPRKVGQYMAAARILDSGEAQIEALEVRIQRLEAKKAELSVKKGQLESDFEAAREKLASK